MNFDNVEKGIIKKVSKIKVAAVLGGDPEFFVANSRGKILSADKFFPGKGEPIRIDSDHAHQSRLFFDGIQAEIAIAQHSCREYLADNAQQCLSHVYRHIPKDHKIVIKPASKIDMGVIKGASEEARIFGCEPDFNAYTRSVNTPEMDASRHPYRYAGGHMHFGISSPYRDKDSPEFLMAKMEEGHIRIVRFMDLLLSIPTLILDSGAGSKRRRDKYGKAGCFRPTPYGIEYRTPSCWWLQSPLTMSLVYGFGRLAWTMVTVDADNDLRKVIGFDEDTIRGAIDETDTITAYKIWEQLRPYVALASRSQANPVHIGSARSTENNDVFPVSYHDKMQEHKGRYVYALAAFEYVLKHGLEVLINQDIKKEWSFASAKDVWYGTTGFLNGSYTRLRGSKDFMRFQECFLKEKVYTKA